MNRNVEFTKLMYLARDHMEENGFSPTTVIYHMRTWRSIYAFAKSMGIENYSAELAEQYMREKYHMALGEKQLDGERLSPYMQQKVRSIEALTNFYLHGFVPKIKHSHGVDIQWPTEYEEICRKYLEYIKGCEYQKQTLRKHELDLSRFAAFLHSRNVLPENIEAVHLYQYFTTLTHLSKSNLAAIKSTLNRSLKFFYKEQVTKEDLSVYLPRIRYYAKAKIDKIWSEDEVKAMLETIDRSNALGKRDYAIMLIAANLGFRTCDIINLKISDFAWNQGCISIIQQKTGEPLTLPITESVGKAVIDYWKNGRPETCAEELFVEHVLPYQKLTHGIIYHMFNKYYESSGITVPDTRAHGLHSLRHSLASRLLEKDVPVNVISNILGHVDSNTAKAYIQVDIEKLRQCSLEVPDYEI